MPGPARDRAALQRRIATAAAAAAVALAIGLACADYFRFINQNIHEESRSHLSEVFSQVNDKFSSLVSENWNLLDSWGYHIASLPEGSDVEIGRYVAQERAKWGFTDFYFMDENGGYLTGNGASGYFDLGDQLAALMLEGRNVVVDGTLPEGAGLTLFAVPAARGQSYRGFEYSAIAVSYNNADMEAALDVAAFDGQSECFVTYADGRILFSANIREDQPFNYLAYIGEKSNLDAASFAALQEDFEQGRPGMVQYEATGAGWYLVYQPVGFQDWMLLAVVPKDVANAAMNRNLQATALVFAGIFAVLGVAAITFFRQRGKRELEAKQAELAARANEAKSAFLAKMSHDIRTPVNGIKGTTELALANIDDAEKAAEYLRASCSSVQHLLDLINDILDMSKIESGQMTLHEQPFDLGQMVEEITSIMRPQADAKGQRLLIEAGGVEHRSLVGDPLRIRQVLLNLLSNAVKYTGEGGRVELRIEEREQEDPSAARLRFTVSDNGIGMPEEFLERIFNPFERSDQPGVDAIQGSGLGMPIAKSLVEAMGGSIAVESQVGRGSTFEVLLDLRTGRGEEVACADEHAKRYEWEGKRFLLAEDNEINALVFEGIVGATGVEIEWVENGQLAVEAFASKPAGYYDVVFLDVQMPVMGGHEAAAAIRALPRADATTARIVALTANAFVEDVQAALDAGMDAHVSKPIVMENLEQALLRLG